MTLAEFRRYNSLPDEALAWLLKYKIDTPIGDFEVFLHNVEDADKSPPNLHMVKLAAEILNFVRRESEFIVDIVYGSYKSAVVDGSITLVWPRIATNLPRHEIVGYINSRKLIVSKHASRIDDPYTCHIGIRIPWDEEHGLDLLYKDGVIKTINEDLFHFDGETLMLE